MTFPLTGTARTASGVTVPGAVAPLAVVGTVTRAWTPQLDPPWTPTATGITVPGPVAPVVTIAATRTWSSGLNIGGGTGTPPTGPTVPTTGQLWPRGDTTTSG